MGRFGRMRRLGRRRRPKRIGHTSSTLSISPTYSSHVNEEKSKRISCCGLGKSRRKLAPKRLRSAPTITMHRGNEREISCTSLKSLSKDELPYSLSQMPPESVNNISNILRPSESRILKKKTLLNLSSDAIKEEDPDEKDDHEAIEIITLSPSNRSGSSGEESSQSVNANCRSFTGLNLRSRLCQRWGIRICA